MKLTFLEEFCDRILVLSLPRRTDRREHAAKEFAKIGVRNWDWVDGYDKPIGGYGVPSGNRGCVEGHRRILEIICYNKWNRVLVLEDDFSIRPEFAGDFHGTLEKMIKQVPADARITYLGGGYADTPRRKVSANVIEVSRMLTTSSFLIGHQQAERMAPYIGGCDGPIDNLFHAFTEKGGSYCVTPRLIIQYTSMSDLTDQEVSYEGSMTDAAHEEMLLDGEAILAGPDLYALKGKIQRREIAAPGDMDGSMVIVGEQRYTVKSIDFTKPRGPWYRGEEVTYWLKKV